VLAVLAETTAELNLRTIARLSGVSQGVRLGKRAAGQDHDRAAELLKEAGRDLTELGKNLRRLLPMKPRAEYDPDDIPLSAASNMAVDRARTWSEVFRSPTRCVLGYAVADGHSTRTHRCLIDSVGGVVWPLTRLFGLVSFDTT
jgi:hypothetical protein